MNSWISALLPLLCAATLSAQNTIPQLNKSKPPERPIQAPERETIDPKDYPCYTEKTFTEGPVATWLKDVRPAVVDGDPAKMKNAKTDANWRGKATLKYETVTDAKRNIVKQGVSRATWNSTGKLYAEGTWRDNAMHGAWKLYNEQGALETVLCYSAGSLDGPYAEFKDGALTKYSLRTDKSSNIEYRHFNKDGWLEWRTASDGKTYKKVWDRHYNAKGQLTYLRNYVDGKAAGDQLSWIDPQYDKDGKLTNAGYAGRLEVKYFDEKNQYHGWQSFYAVAGAYRVYDVWYEHGEQTGPAFINDATGKQISGGQMTKGIKTGAWWSVDFAGNREEYRLNEKGEKDGEYSRVAPDGRVLIKGTYAKDKKTGYWTVHDHSSGLVPWDVYVGEMGDWRGEGEYRDDLRVGKWSWYRDNGKLGAEGSYTLGRGSGDWKFYFADGVTTAADGAYELGSRTGAWTFYFSDGKKQWEGSFVEGKRQGIWISYGAKGGKASEGSYDNDLPTGEWTYFYNNANKSAEGSYVKGKKQGLWVTYHSAGGKESEGSYDKDLRTGEWSTYHPNGKLRTKGTYVLGRRYSEIIAVHIGQWDTFNEQGELTQKTYYGEGSPEQILGEAKREAPLDAVPEGVTVDPAQPNGTWATYRGSGAQQVLVGRVVAVNGQPWGMTEQYYPDGTLGIEGVQYGNRREGLWKFFHPDGKQKEEATYVNGIPEGAYKSWRADGSLESSGEYHQAKKHGPWVFYHEDGKRPRRQITYGEDEKYDGPLTDYYANGKVQEKGTYAAGGQEGEWLRFYENGAKRSIVNYKADRLWGSYQEWHKNGQKSEEATFGESGREGESQSWYDNGQLKSKGSYKDGKKIGDWNEWYDNGDHKSESHYDDEGKPKGRWLSWNKDGSVLSDKSYD